MTTEKGDPIPGPIVRTEQEKETVIRPAPAKPTAPSTKAPPPKQASGRPSAPMAPPPAPPTKIEIDTELLSRSLWRDLTYNPRHEWHQIESIFCRVEFTHHLADAVRLVNAIADRMEERAGLFAMKGLERRRKLEEGSQEIIEAFRVFVRAAVGVARNLNLDTLLERHWWLLSVYGPPAKKREPDEKKSHKAQVAAEPKKPAAVA